jgi:diaminopimelate epimerase
MTGTGNDFILIDNRDGRLDADRSHDLVRQACRHKLSVGADGVILIERDPEVDFKWRFFNADASEAEMCGNGARCAARFAWLTAIVAHPRMAFRTLAGVIHAEVSGRKVKVQMTLPHSLRTGIRLNADGRPVELDFINTGVPHAVRFAAGASDLEATDVAGLGRAIRFHPEFQPAGANVNFVCVQDEHHIAVRTYERGVEAETLACGTGAIASSLISAVRQRVASPVEVRTRSGETLTIYFEMTSSPGDPGGVRFTDVFLEGEARVVCQGELWDETL